MKTRGRSSERFVRGVVAKGVCALVQGRRPVARSSSASQRLPGRRRRGLGHACCVVGTAAEVVGLRLSDNHFGGCGGWMAEKGSMLAGVAWLRRHRQLRRQAFRDNQTALVARRRISWQRMVSLGTQAVVTHEIWCRE